MTDPTPNPQPEEASQEATTIHRRAWVLLALVVIIWAVELFFFQHLTFEFDYPVPLHKQLGAGGIRLTLDLLFCAGLVLLLPRILSIASIVSFLLFAQVAGYYFSVFARALSWTTLRAQSAEGLQGAGFDPSYVNWPILLTMLALAGLKILLLCRTRLPRRSRKRRMTLGSLALLAYLAALGVVAWQIDSPRKLRTFMSADRMGMTYGYLPTWVSEMIYLDMGTLIDEAVAARTGKTDRLSAIEPPLGLRGDVVIIQTESLDWRVLHHRVDDRAVMPYLSELASQAMLFKIEAYHRNGSGDCDFIMLTATPPSPTVMTYTLVDYPYENTLPEVAARAGYVSSIFHGNSGRFFSRRRAFQEMPFERVIFFEELTELFGAAPAAWGVRDDVVLATSSELLQRGDSPQLHFIITLTSHQPFIYLEPEEATFMPDASGITDRYFNHMNFVDRALEQYIEQLAPGTLVFVLGDHRAAVEYESTFDAPEGSEHVPLLIHRVGDPLAGAQQSRGAGIDQSGELTMIDVASYVHSLFESEGDRP